MKITFADGEKLGVYENGEKKIYESAYITRYKENALKAAKSKEWKKSSDLMMSEDYYFDTEDESEVRSLVHVVSPTIEENKIVYAFTVNGTSGIYYKYTDDKEQTEAHLISSNEVEFTSLSLAKTGDMLATVRTDSVCSNIAIFDKNGGGEYKTLTGGDSLDENPSMDKDGKVLFNSYAVGRDQNNAFITYLPSEIYEIDPETLDIRTLVSDRKLSYIKPIKDKDGNLYCIRKPDEDNDGENIFLQILLIPVRILQAIGGFISAFVMCFAKKPLVNGQSARSIGNGGDAAKNGVDKKKVWVNNNLVHVDKELKKNKKSEEYGFIPRSWTLVQLMQDENGKFIGEYELARGVADYCITEEDGKTALVYTNGKRVFALTEEKDVIKKKKLFETDFCLKVNAR
ncbi:MAG: hypothetical protein IJX96_01975 [Clostridia bacterium]|nr:hypothetical protein [Clostridia bacterium]